MLVVAANHPPSRGAVGHRLATFALTIALPLALGLAACVQAKSPTQEWDAGIPLTWDDFSGPRPENAQHDAETATGITALTWTCVEGRLVVAGARAFFSRTRSFATSDKTDADLLKHEQGHFDLTELSARQLRERLRGIACADREPEEIQEAVDLAASDTAQGFIEVSEWYDRETNHGRDKARQESWNQMLREQLAQTKGQ
jgi:hypothetical protein